VSALEYERYVVVPELKKKTVNTPGLVPCKCCQNDIIILPQVGEERKGGGRKKRCYFDRSYLMIDISENKKKLIKLKLILISI
jgi:hypothetical protein